MLQEILKKLIKLASDLKRNMYIMQMGSLKNQKNNSKKLKKTRIPENIEKKTETMRRKVKKRW